VNFLLALVAYVAIAEVVGEDENDIGTRLSPEDTGAGEKQEAGKVSYHDPTKKRKVWPIGQTAVHLYYNDIILISTKFIVMEPLFSEKIQKPSSGYFMLFVILAILVFAILLLAQPGSAGAGVVCMVLFILLSKGLLVVQPNTAKVFLLFGAYRGSVRTSGLYWVNPFYGRQTLSIRARNFESDQLKVNDKLGNPVLISIILVWNVKDTYRASFAVDDYAKFVKVQADAAVRKLAASYPYDHFEDERAGITLSTDFDQVNATLEHETAERLDMAGIEVVEARITHLSYAPEIASAMLRRQQATAVVAARHKIVEGAVSMVESALNLLSSKNIIELDEEKRAAMVSNLMVVLCGDREAQPIVNTGTLNH
jgi:regulator of protease activity HflC (stomatin/prohibitin superfamily)